MYALLTGRVQAINGTARQNVGTGEYVYLGGLEQRAGMKEFGIYAQDQWRATPTLTLNGGLRWEVQLPFTGKTNTWSNATLTDLCGVSGLGSGPQGQACNMFTRTIGNPGAVSKYTAYDSNNPGYDTKWGNIAPNFGLAWRPNVQSGFLRTILGDPDQATIRAGYAFSYNRERMDRFTGLIGNNPGGTTAANRNATNGNLALGGGWPVLFRETNRLGPPAVCADNNINASCMPRAPIYPILATTSNSINIYDPEITLPYVQSWSAGFQRSLGTSSAIEIRYIGNQNTKAWGIEDWNERVIFENGFFDEFKKAQANLALNIAANKGNTFAYRADVPGSNPLPIYLAHLNGRSDATNAAAYTGSSWTNTTLTGRLAVYNPNVEDAADDLFGDATRRASALAAGLPANFFAMNPQVGDANIMRSTGGGRYHSMQIEYRRRLSKGLLVNASYTYARTFSYVSESLARERFYLESAGVPHAWRVNWNYELPVGRGRRFGNNWGSVLNAILGNWEFSGTSRLQIQSFAVSGARLVGMDKSELQDAFKIRRAVDANGVLNVYSMPDDIILNTRRAYSVSATLPGGYSALGAPTGRYIAPASQPGCIYMYEGDCGVNRFFINGPLFKKVDVRLTKKFLFFTRASADVSIEFMNVFNTVNENATFNPGSGATIFQVTSGYRDTGVDVNDPGGRIGQIVWRISW